MLDLKIEINEFHCVCWHWTRMTIPFYPYRFGKKKFVYFITCFNAVFIYLKHTFCWWQLIHVSIIYFYRLSSLSVRRWKENTHFIYTLSKLAPTWDKKLNIFFYFLIIENDFEKIFFFFKKLIFVTSVVVVEIMWLCQNNWHLACAVGSQGVQKMRFT